MLEAPSGRQMMPVCAGLSGVIFFPQGLPNPFQAARYHSLVIDKDSCPEDLEVTAWTQDGIIMGVRHKRFPHIQVACILLIAMIMACSSYLLKCSWQYCHYWTVMPWCFCWCANDL